jgi:hypothetical protein
MTKHKEKVEAYFVTTWDEVIALEHDLRLFRSVASERYGVDNIQMKFLHPWRGPNHTEFSLIVEGTPCASAAEVKRWLQRVVKDFLGHYKEHPKKKRYRGRPRRAIQGQSKA